MSTIPVVVPQAPWFFASGGTPQQALAKLAAATNVPAEVVASFTVLINYAISQGATFYNVTATGYESGTKREVVSSIHQWY